VDDQQRTVGTSIGERRSGSLPKTKSRIQLQSSDRRQNDILRAMRGMPFLLLSVLVSGALSAATASAESPAIVVKVHQASGVVSPYFQLTASPGRSVAAGSLQVVNPTSRPLTVRLDPVDAITTNTLGSAYAQTGGAIHGPTTWLRLSRRVVVIPRHASKSVSVSLDVPGAATPGDYLGGVAVEALGQTSTAKVSKGVAIGETDRYAIGVEVRLPGPRTPIVKFSGATVSREPSGLVFHVNAHNTGNVILTNVHGSVRVTTGSRVVGAATIQPGTFVSGTSISYPLAAPHEQPTPGSSYRVQGVLRYAGGIARLDTRVVFSHAAAVKQENYGGRKLPKSTPAWRWLVLLLLALAMVIGALKLLQRRRRPLNRPAGLKLLDRYLGPDGERPVSLVLIRADGRTAGAIASTIHPRLRRSDRVCDLGRHGVLVICPRTTRPAANALRDDIEAQLARHPGVGGIPIKIAVATANKTTTAQKLLDRVTAARHQQPPKLSPRRRPTTTGKR
jgi:hypothetical protein